MKFSQYFKRRRKELGLEQKDFPGFDPSYISKIERGKNNPLKLDKIASLAATLKIPPNMVYWLWGYSFFDRDPYECIPPQSSQESQSLTVYDGSARYQTLDSKKIAMGASPADVRRILGVPDDDFRFGNREKWIYERKAIHIVFTDGKVSDVMFK